MSTQGDRAAKLIQKLDDSGLFKRMGYQEVVTACIYIAARSLRDQAGMRSMQALTAVAKSCTMMHQQADLLEKAWDEDKKKESAT